MVQGFGRDARVAPYDAYILTGPSIGKELGFCRHGGHQAPLDGDVNAQLGLGGMQRKVWSASPTVAVVAGECGRMMCSASGWTAQAISTSGGMAGLA